MDEKHQPNCLGYLCTCGTLVESDFNQITEPTDEESHDFDRECDCYDCHQDREAEKDREFDERVALGYFV